MSDRDEEAGTGASRGADGIAPERLTSELSLRPARPEVMRLSGRMLAALGGVSALVLGGAAWLALGAHPKSTTAPQLYNIDNRATAEGLSRLPHDYAGLPKPTVGIPQLGPPLPGDLGKPMLDAGVQPATTTGAEGAATGASAATPAQQARQAAHQRTAQIVEAARTSGLFARAADAVDAPKGAASATTIEPALLALGAAASGAPAATAAVPAETDHKLAFLTAPTDHHTISAERVEGPTSANVLQAGAVIAAALITGMRSDLPGQVTAQVTEAVYDSPTGRTLLIPQGARLIGQYDAQVAFGQARALLAWTRLIFPNGRSIVLERQPGADARGYAGLEGSVDNHWEQLFKAAVLSTVLSVASEAGTSSNANNLAQALQSGAADSLSQTGRQVVGRSLTVAPTLIVQPGSPVRVIVTHDLVLEPYAG